MVDKCPVKWYNVPSTSIVQFPCLWRGGVETSGAAEATPTAPVWMIMESIAVLVALHTAHGSITAYGGEFIGQRLFCSTPSNPLDYDRNAPRWVAMPIGSGALCGDLVYIPGLGMFTVLDFGPFGDHCVATSNQCLPIRADVPAIHAPFKLSMTGEVINISAIVRACRERGYCDD